MLTSTLADCKLPAVILLDVVTSVFYLVAYLLSRGPAYIYLGEFILYTDPESFMELRGQQELT